MLADPHHLRYGTQAVFLIAIFYTFTVIGLTVNHASVATPPVIAIPVQDYYFWQSFFTLPVFVFAWILAAGLAHLLSKFFMGSGTFEGTVAVLGFALWLLGFVTWSVETVITVLTLVGVMHQGALDGTYCTAGILAGVCIYLSTDCPWVVSRAFSNCGWSSTKAELVTGSHRRIASLWRCWIDRLPLHQIKLRVITGLNDAYDLNSDCKLSL